MTSAEHAKRTRQSTSSGNGYTDFSKFSEQAFKNLQNFKIPGFDSEQFMASHRRNMETLTELQKAATEAVRTFGRLQNQYARQAMEDAAMFSRNMTQAGTSFEDQIEAQSNSVKQLMQHATEQGKEMNKQFTQAQNKVIQLCNTRMSECMEECQSMAKNAAHSTKE